jgi:hypothetical protein
MSSIASSSQHAAAGALSGQLDGNGDEKNRRVSNWYAEIGPTCANAITGFSSVVIKVGMVGDSQIGKTSLMVKYVEGSFDEDYIQTLGEAPQ